LASILEDGNLRLIYRGAEAEVYLGLWYGRRAIFKYRKPKGYRIKEIDDYIRSRRTIQEARILRDAKNAGIPSPTVYYIDPSEALLVMSYIPGSRLKEYIGSIPIDEAVTLSRRIGYSIAKLHRAGIQHGDPTTSNMILVSDGRIFLVDYGLSQYTVRAEDRAVDLILFERALLSVHYKIYEYCMKAFIEEYRRILGEEYSEVERRMREIKARGRYISKRLLR
jgi:Kae1-associated kinase Bud32